MIEIFKIGTSVSINDSEVPISGLITGVQIGKNGNCKYKINYFLAGDYKEIWVYDFEFSVEKQDEKERIGFK